MSSHHGADQLGPVADERQPIGPTHIALGLVVVIISGVWIWIYAFAPRGNPDRFEDPAYAAAVEPICATAQAEIDALPSFRDAETPQGRAEVVEAGTIIVEGMVVALKADADLITDSHERRVLEAWFEDWDAYLVDRWRHVEQLDLASPDAHPRDLAFNLSERVEGGQYTLRIDGLANVNDMPSCHTPLDI